MHAGSQIQHLHVSFHISIWYYSASSIFTKDTGMKTFTESSKSRMGKLKQIIMYFFRINTTSRMSPMITT